jgi:hypothetical protein
MSVLRMLCTRAAILGAAGMRPARLSALPTVAVDAQRSVPSTMLRNM